MVRDRSAGSTSATRPFLARALLNCAYPVTVDVFEEGDFDLTACLPVLAPDQLCLPLPGKLLRSNG